MKNRILGAALAALTIFCVQAGAQTQSPYYTRSAGRFIASRYNWSVGQIRSTNSVAVGASTMIMNAPSVTLLDGSTLYPFQSPEQLMIDQGTSIAEVVSVTSTSGCSTNAPNATCTITATFANAHGPSANVTSATYGLQEALNDAAQAVAGAQQSLVIAGTQLHGEVVLVDSTWPGTSVAAPQTGATITPWPNVAIEDTHGAVPQWYSIQPSNATAVATAVALINTTPTTCTGTATICSTANATLGGTTATWTSAAAYFCTTYVDLMGNEGPCSPTMHFTTAATVTVQVQPPAAATGAVGYLVYAGASYAAVTRLPLVAGTTGGPTCVLTTIETVTPACAVTNTTYNQTGSVATFALIDASTQPQPPGATTTTFTTLQSIDETHTVYSYQQTNAVPPNFVTNDAAYATIASSTSGTTFQLGRRHLPAGYLNTIGKTIRVTGQISVTPNTVPTLSVLVALGPPWTASLPANVCSMVNTTAESAVVWNISFSCTITTQTTGATGTVLGNGWYMQQFTTQTTAGNLAVNNIVSPVTVNLTAADEVDILMVDTSSTNSTTPVLQQLSIETLN